MGAASLHNEVHANRPVHIYIYIVDSVVTLCVLALWTCSRDDNDNRSSTVLFIRSCGSAQTHINRPNESVA